MPVPPATAPPELTGSGARVLPVPPPVYYAAALVLGTAAGRALDLGWSDGSVSTPAGAALVAAGVALAGAGVGAVVRARTTIVPHRPVRTLVTTGAYRLTRNPMYAGLAGVHLGAALLLRAPLALAALPVVMALVQALVIRPEEDYLAVSFPEDYPTYRGRVRRWL